MSLDLSHLDSCTRHFTLAELEADRADGSLYQSPLLSADGLRHYCRLPRDAIVNGNDVSFAEALCAHNAVRPPHRWQHPREVGPEDALAETTIREPLIRTVMTGPTENVARQV